MVKRGKLPTGIYKVQDGFACQVFFHLFGIASEKLESLSAAKRSLTAMKEVKAKVDDELLKLILDGSVLHLDSFQAAVREAVQKVKKSKGNIVEKWKYFAKKEKVFTVSRDSKLEHVLEQWRRKCTWQSQGTLSEIIGTDGLQWRREKAEEFAADMFIKEEGKPSNLTVLQLMRLWGFAKNTRRSNVAPEGEAFVYSDTIGLVENKGTREVVLSDKGSEHVLKLLTSWAAFKFGCKFPFTSVALNKHFCSRLHRDANNVGPSVGCAVGSFTGGELHYFFSDQGGSSATAWKVRGEPSMDLNLRNRAVAFDGCKAHEVLPYVGEERFSLVFFTMKGHERAKASHQDAVEKAGALKPTKAALEKLRQKIPKGRASSKVLKKLKRKTIRKSASSSSSSQGIRWKPLPSYVVAREGMRKRVPGIAERIKFQMPNPKNKGGDAAKRYNTYMHASTIQEAYRCGAWRGDIAPESF